MAPFCFLHFTDPHVPPPGGTVSGGDPAQGLAAALADAARRHGPGGASPAAFAVFTGDLVRDGEPAAYARLRGMLGGLPWPVHLLLGNHDDRDAFSDAFPAEPLDDAGFVQKALQTPAGLCLMLDTLAPGRLEGELCARRLAWLAARLAESAGPVLLFLHHPPLPVGIPFMDQIALRDADALWATLEPHRARVRHIFHGHLHRPIAGSWRGMPISSLRGTAFAVALDQQPGEAVVSRTEAPCYALARVLDGDVVVHTVELPGANPPAAAP
ncbi:phosphodiesterase [Craurococcus roseus]|uniref:Phosphodiesterase n=1 Tax=Craurococcus roseus TaxID=77585 RepID=A0ABP3PK10_9PROT